MKRLIAAIASTAMVLGTLVAGSPPASASTTWAFPTSSFTITETAGSSTATVVIQNLRITDGSAASGYVQVTAVGSTCSTSSFTGLDANFFVGTYEPCSGSVSFSVSAGGDLAVTTALVVKGSLFAGPATGPAQGTPWPPQMTCTATLSGSTGVDLAWKDPGTGASSYDITATPALPLPVSISAGPTTTTITGLAFGTDYTVTVTGSGGTALAATCSFRTANQPNPPVGAVALGAITGTANGNAERAYTLTADPPPTGWSLEWSGPSGPMTAHGSQSCNSSSTATPQWTQFGYPPVTGAPVPVNTTCTVPTPVLAPYPSSQITGTDVTVNFAFGASAGPGTVVWATYQLTSGKTELGPISLGSPPANGSSGTASFSVPGLKPPTGVRVRLYATNGPVASLKDAWRTIPNQGRTNSVSYDPSNPASENTTVTTVTGSPMPDLPPSFNPPSWRPNNFMLTRPLPAGLILNSTTGVISGTPLTPVARLQSVVKATVTSTGESDFTVVRGYQSHHDSHFRAGRSQHTRGSSRCQHRRRWRIERL
jgi:hypothetical protein